jgi:hypothetical protein
VPCHRTQVPYSGLGLYDAALAGAERACEHDDRGFGFSLAEFVKAGALGIPPRWARPRVIVTGAGRGIGAAHGALLASRGSA